MNHKNGIVSVVKAPKRSVGDRRNARLIKAGKV